MACLREWQAKSGTLCTQVSRELSPSQSGNERTPSPRVLGVARMRKRRVRTRWHAVLLSQAQAVTHPSVYFRERSGFASPGVQLLDRRAGRPAQARKASRAAVLHVSRQLTGRLFPMKLMIHAGMFPRASAAVTKLTRQAGGSPAAVGTS